MDNLPNRHPLRVLVLLSSSRDLLFAVACGIMEQNI